MQRTKRFNDEVSYDAEKANIEYWIMNVEFSRGEQVSKEGILTIL